VTLAGKVTLKRLVQAWKATLPIVTIAAGRSILDRPEQVLKAPAPIEVTLGGMVTLESTTQL